MKIVKNYFIIIVKEIISLSMVLFISNILYAQSAIISTSKHLLLKNKLQKNVNSDTLDNPISPQDYKKMLGKGFDVNWTKTASQAAYYNVDLLKQIKAKGFNHIRLRTNSESPTDYISISEPIVKDCLANDMIPVLAFGGQMLEENPDSTNIAAFVEWWRTVAEHYKNFSHKVSFNLLIEISGELKNQPDKLNDIYEKTVTKIRESNPTRIVILAPRKLSNPFYLHELDIPTKANGYLMWEWHFYAAGPSKTNKNKLWTIGTFEEKKLLTDKIDAAIDWENETGFPSWVGAWMPGNYNDADESSIPEQVAFSAFMVRELEKANIPWALNAIQHFNNYLDGNNEWKQERLPVLDIVIDPWSASLYSDLNFGGNNQRLSEGNYNKNDLDSLNLIENIKSVMVPPDFKIYFYSGEEFNGDEKIISVTTNDIFSDAQSFSFQSIKIIYDTTTTDVNDYSGTENLPNAFKLEQNYPNPFNPTTTINYSIPTLIEQTNVASDFSLSNVKLKVFDILGKEVTTLVNKKQTPGNYQVIFNAKNLTSGIYFYRLQSGNYIQTKKMLILR